MQTITAPEYSPAKYNKTLFLAGGISNCMDWQSEILNKLYVEPITVYNPRRENFNIENTEESKKQIYWEHYYLVRSKAVSFWFPDSSVCPITLFELGSSLERHMSNNQKVFVGCDPNYSRRLDIEIQISCVDNNIHMVYNIDDLAKLIKSNI